MRPRRSALPDWAEVARMSAHGRAVTGSTDIGQHDGLLGERVGVQGRRFGDLRGVGCLTVVPPGVDDLAAVERLSADKRVRVGEDHGKRTPDGGFGCVGQQVLEVFGVEAQLGEQGRRTEPSVEPSRVVDLRRQKSQYFGIYRT